MGQVSVMRVELVTLLTMGIQGISTTHSLGGTMEVLGMVRVELSTMLTTGPWGSFSFGVYHVRGSRCDEG